MGDLQQVVERIRQFRDARDWQQFHNAAKDHREVCICAIREEL